MTPVSNRFQLTVQGDEEWTGYFQAMNTLSDLRPGYYGNLQGFPENNPTVGGISWNGEGRGCSDATVTRGPGQQLVLVFDDVDRYGRIVVQAWVGNLNINEEVVRRGAAWSDSVYAPDDRLYQIEQEARDRKEAMWALPAADRIEPWVWRKEER